MARKKIEEQTIEELQKARITHRSVIVILLVLLGIYFLFIIYKLLQGGWPFGPESFIVPLMVAAGILPAFTQIKAIKKELKDRGKSF